MTVQNKVAMRRVYEEAWNQGDLTVVDEVFSPNCVIHYLPPNAPSGPEGFCWYVQMFRAAFPDLHIQIDDMLADGDKVVARITARGTHKGQFMDIPPTGKKVIVTGMAIVCFENGKYMDFWGEHDTFGLLQQLGAIPAPQPA